MEPENDQTARLQWLASNNLAFLEQVKKMEAGEIDLIEALVTALERTTTAHFHLRRLVMARQVENQSPAQGE